MRVNTFNQASPLPERIFIGDTSSTSGGGLTGLTSSTASLVVSVMTDNQSAWTDYSGANLQSVVAIGTYSAPSTGKVRFGEVGKGWYEVHLAQSWYGTSGANNVCLAVSVPGGRQVNMMEGLKRFDLQAANPTVANTNAAGGTLITSGTGANQLSVSSGLAQADVAKMSGVTLSNTGNVITMAAGWAYAPTTPGAIGFSVHGGPGADGLRVVGGNYNAGPDQAGNGITINNGTGGSAFVIGTTSGEYTDGLSQAISAVGIIAATILSKLAGITSLAWWLRLLGRSDAADATALSEFNSNAGTFSPGTASLTGIAAAVAAGGGGGGGWAGNVLVRIRVEDASHVVVPGAMISGGGGAGAVDGTGYRTIGLTTAGTFTFTASAPGSGVFWDPVATGVANGSTVVLTGSASVPPMPTEPDQVGLILVTRDASGDLAPGTVVTYWMTEAPDGSNTGFGGDPNTLTSDGAAEIALVVVRGAQYSFKSGSYGQEVSYRIPGSGNPAVPGFVGRDI